MNAYSLLFKSWQSICPQIARLHTPIIVWRRSCQFYYNTKHYWTCVEASIPFSVWMNICNFISSSVLLKHFFLVTTYQFTYGSTFPVLEQEEYTDDTENCCWIIIQIQSWKVSHLKRRCKSYCNSLAARQHLPYVVTSRHVYHCYSYSVARASNAQQNHNLRLFNQSLIWFRQVMGTGDLQP